MSGIRLRTADGDRVTIIGAGEVDLTARRLTIEAGIFRSRGSTGLTVTVPRWATVELEGVNGDIVVEDAPDALEVESFNGQVTVTGGTGTMSISNATGSVTVRDFAGRSLDVESLSGRVTIDGATGTLRVETVNERIVLRNVRSSSVTAESTNGGIEWAGSFATDGRYEFSSHNGNVVMRVPSALNARLRVSTFQGGFSTSIPGITTGDGARAQAGQWGGEREFTVTYGRGGAAVRVETFNGSVRVLAQGET
jgi:DUF4097 and DUF4098 domain-containing protein YvlB